MVGLGKADLEVEPISIPARIGVCSQIQIELVFAYSDSFVQVSALKERVESEGTTGVHLLLSLLLHQECALRLKIHIGWIVECVERFLEAFMHLERVSRTEASVHHSMLVWSVGIIFRI